MVFGKNVYSVTNTGWLIEKIIRSNFKPVNIFRLEYSKEMMMKPEEIDLGRLKMGDHKAFEKIFHTYYDKVRNFLKILTRSEDMADELSQTVFIKLWLYRESVEPSRNFDAYLYTMTRNVAMTALKAQMREELNIYDYPNLEGNGNTDDYLIAKETELLIKMTVNRMPPKRKQVYKMSRYDHKTNEEISEELNISRKVVEKHLRLALGEIKEVIKVFIVFWL